MTAASSRPPEAASPTTSAAALARRWEHDLRLRFVVVGAFNTGVGLLCFPILYLALGRRLPYLALVVVSFVLAVTSAFFTHRWIVFRAGGPVLPQYLRFAAGQMGLLGVSLLGMALLVGHLGVPPLVAQPALSLTMVVLSFAWNSRVTFRGAMSLGATPTPAHAPHTPRGLRAMSENTQVARDVSH